MTKFVQILQDFFTACGVEDLSQLFEDLQQQHAWHLHDGRATESSAAVAAGALPDLLDSLGIQEPSRGRTVEASPTLAMAVTCALYAQKESGLANPAGYLIRRLTSGDQPPDDFLQLSQMSWEQWRVCAAAVCLHARGSRPSAHIWKEPGFRCWAMHYGRVHPDELPFGVGAGIADLAQLLPPLEESDDGEEMELPAVTPADAALWRAVLEELSMQMTQATFAAWLADTRLVERERNRFVVAVRDAAARDWVTHRLREPIENAPLRGWRGGNGDRLCGTLTKGLVAKNSKEFWGQITGVASS
ncbi:MAG: hypothetical protein RRC07_17150 [Anaerolineae bacterium]|nr:hypothetical protein [Anaerolineae bacterium]